MSRSDSEVNTSAFDLGPEGGEGAAALCVHGLTGTPYEMRLIGESLAKRGIRARGPCLPGHLTTPQELAKLSYSSWTQAVDEHYQDLAAEHSKVFVVGLSLGALLTLELASRREVSGLCAIGTPLNLGPPIPQLVPLVKYVMPMLRKREGSDIRDEEARRCHPGYAFMPLESVHQLVRLQRIVRQGLGRIKAPTLVAHGSHDQSATPRDAQRVFDGIGSSEKELVFYQNSGHVVTVDYDRVALTDRVVRFFCDQI